MMGIVSMNGRWTTVPGLGGASLGMGPRAIRGGAGEVRTASE